MRSFGTEFSKSGDFMKRCFSLLIVFALSFSLLGCEVDLFGLTFSIGNDAKQLEDDPLDPTASYTKVLIEDGHFFAYSFNVANENYYAEGLLESEDFTAEDFANTDNCILYQNVLYTRCLGRGGLFSHSVKKYEHTFKNSDGKLTVTAGEDGNLTVVAVKGKELSLYFSVGDILYKNIIHYYGSDGAPVVVTSRG